MLRISSVGQVLSGTPMDSPAQAIDANDCTCGNSDRGGSSQAGKALPSAAALLLCLPRWLSTAGFLLAAARLPERALLPMYAFDMLSAGSTRTAGRGLSPRKHSHHCRSAPFMEGTRASSGVARVRFEAEASVKRKNLTEHSCELLILETLLGTHLENMFPAREPEGKKAPITQGGALKPGNAS